VTQFRSATALFRPRSIAIVGASESGGAGWPRAIYQNLEHAGFPAALYLVNPNRSELWGRPVYPTLSAIPAPVDLALVIVPAEASVAVLADAAAHRVECALLYAARFGEGGDEAGAERARAVTALCARTGLRVSGPNCMGSLSLRQRLLFYPAPRVRGLPAGPLGVVFQSGGTFQYWLQQAATRGLGFSYAVSSGNEIDLDLADYINFLVEDDATRAIACMVEGVRRPDAFMAVARRALAANKPVLVVKIGRSDRGRASTQSHTGALAGDDAVFDAMCARYGVTRCATLDDLIDTALAFMPGRLPRGNRVAMAGVSGGAKGLFLDYAAEADVSFATLAPETLAGIGALIDPGVRPDNPLDTGASVANRPEVFGKICRAMADDPAVDIIAMQGQLPLAADEPANPVPFLNVAEAGKPVLAYGRLAQNVTDVGRAFQAQTGVPFLQGLPETARALRALIDYAERTRRGIAVIPAPAGKPQNLAGDALDAALAAYDLPPPRSVRAGSAAECGHAAAQIGFPVALKIMSPDALHKTEIGGVALNLASADAVTAEAARMSDRLRGERTAARIDGFLIQEMMSGVELLAGVREDPQYGPVMVVGLGGVLVEALGDVALRLLPVDDAEARAMLESLRGRAVLGTFRGRPARDVAAICRAIAGLSRFYLDHRAWLTDIEINPLVALPDGVRAVDVRMVSR
jgi:acetyltransferase